MDIKIKVFEPHCCPEKHGDWIDLMCREDVSLLSGRRHMIALGVAMDIPEGYEAHIVPRSSTFKNYGLIQTNHMGVIDNAYSGPNDEWHWPGYVLESRGLFTIHKGTRLCQFRIVKKQEPITFIKSTLEGNTDRGGLGSTGK